MATCGATGEKLSCVSRSSREQGLRSTAIPADRQENLHGSSVCAEICELRTKILTSILGLDHRICFLDVNAAKKKSGFIHSDSLSERRGTFNVTPQVVNQILKCHLLSQRVLEDVEKVKMERSLRTLMQSRDHLPLTPLVLTHIQNSLLETSLTPSVREHLQVGNFRREEK